MMELLWLGIERGRSARVTSEVYSRPLPGGGFVAIRVTLLRRLLGRATYRGQVIVERRQPERREGHTPPAVARAESPDLERVLRDLLPIAQSNVALARACLARRDSTIRNRVRAGQLQAK
jgi:hypothetical protein